ncbi:suppressor of fused domain protein [Bacillus sp. H-16]|uniref:suppressor of fused domain protein n=1 Tax=Alteribacter salitolerans TaxID=2912333 RepID=UPI001965C76F|nr:suppressor of fused domain protein [Alteribacter salitolerans]MBM7094426.1 suppressor of fused domain protein [Alteribacter salitolerans]
MSKFIDFLEEQIGEIERGWIKDPSGKQLPFQIVKFSEGPLEETNAYCSLGLSNELLGEALEGEHVRQELVFASYNQFEEEAIPFILQNVVQMAIRSNTPFRRGDVIGPYGPMFGDSLMEAFYVTTPVYFPSQFRAYEINEEVIIELKWLIPITAKEADFIQQSGWGKFEDLLEEHEPDLIDAGRPCLIELYFESEHS